MKQLEKTFTGKGKTGGFIFTQIKEDKGVFMYQVSTDGSTHYEVFERREREAKDAMLNGVMVHYEAKVVYPSENDFGVWAYCCSSLANAEKRFIELQGRVEEKIKAKQLYDNQ